MFPVSRILEKKLCQSVQTPDEFPKQSGFDTNYIMGVKRTSSVLTFLCGRRRRGRRRGGREEEGGGGRAREDKLVVVLWVVGGGGGRGGGGRGGELLI